MTRATDNPRLALLAAAEEQLAASPDGDIATRAVCEAVGVTQPVLYRIFGDKRGLLDALADAGLERYTARKAELEVSDDPVADLRAGWGDHLAFAAEHPALYQLMFTPRPWASVRAREGVSALLESTLTRCAAAGALRVSVDVAATVLLSANIGLAMNRIAEPGRFGRASVSDALRDAVFAFILTGVASAPAAPAAASVSQQLRAQLRISPPEELSAEEAALLNVWLARLN